MSVRDPTRERSAVLAEPVIGIALVALAAAAINLIALAIAVAVSLIF